MFRPDELDIVLPRADSVVLTTPLTSDTTRLFSCDRIARMKDGAGFINIGRAGAVDHPALIKLSEMAGRQGPYLTCTMQNCSLVHRHGGAREPYVNSSRDFRRLGRLFAEELGFGDRKLAQAHIRERTEHSRPLIEDINLYRRGMAITVC
jgi:D-isomer specific 2-hydroxyacid dehydrogenase-like protein